MPLLFTRYVGQNKFDFTVENEADFIKNHTGHNLQAEASATTSLNLFLNKSEKLFPKLNKDNMQVYFGKLEKRYRACCLALGYMFEPLNESVVIKIRANEIIDFLKRMYFFDVKKLASHFIFLSEMTQFITLNL